MTGGMTMGRCCGSEARQVQCRSQQSSEQTGKHEDAVRDQRCRQDGMHMPPPHSPDRQKSVVPRPAVIHSCMLSMPTVDGARSSFHISVHPVPLRPRPRMATHTAPMPRPYSLLRSLPGSLIRSLARSLARARARRSHNPPPPIDDAPTWDLAGVAHRLGVESLGALARLGYALLRADDWWEGGAGAEDGWEEVDGAVAAVSCVQDHTRADVLDV